MSEEILIENGFKNLLDTLANLASMKVQDRYIVNGTKEEYIVPEDLLEDLSSELYFFRFDGFPDRIPKLIEIMGEESYKILDELNIYIGRNSDFYEKYTHANLVDLIHGDPIWGKIREESNRILNMVNFDLEKWEAENA